MASSRRDGRAVDPEAAGELRFVEPPLDPLRLLTGTLVVGSRSALIACGAGFLIILGLWLTLEEAVTDIWIDAGIDPISRMWLGVLAAVTAVAASVFALSLSADRLLLVRRLSLMAQTDPAGVPPSTVRRMASSDPFLPLLVLSRSVIGVAVTVALIDLAMWGLTDDLGATMLVLGLCVFPIGGLLLLNGAMKGARTTSWETDVTELRRVWPGEVIGAAVSAEAERCRSFRSARDRKPPRPRGRRMPSLVVTGMIVVAAGAAIHFAGVFLRQPGRHAEQIDYAEPGEVAIDVLSLVGASLVTLGLLLLFGAGVRALVRRSSSRRRLLRAPVEGSERPVRVDVEKALVEPSSTEMVGAVLLAAAVMAISPILAALTVASEPQHPLNGSSPSIVLILVVLTGAALVGLVLVATGLVTARSFRQALRERLHPGDDPAPGSPGAPAVHLAPGR